MNRRTRLRKRIRRMRQLPPPLRLPYLRQPLDVRSERLAVRRVSSLTDVPRADVESFVAEIAGDAELHRELAAGEDEYLRTVGEGTGTVQRREGVVLYALVRSLRADTVVETGTANGMSTAFVTAALERNGAGRLVSIDLPFGVGRTALVDGGPSELGEWDYTVLPPGREPGWMVPERLRDRWTLRLGDARDLLEPTLRELGRVDLFFHDSLHTREHMLFEFETAWPHLRPGGVLVAHDVFQFRHDALPAFAASVGRPFSTFAGMGFVKR